MDVKTKLLLSLMHDNNYFKDLNSYLREMVEQNKLSYDNLKYLYSKMYINKSLFIKQNIFPVSQFLIKGYSTEEAEKLANLLPDAYGVTIFCYDEKEKGKLFNKLFMDLEFVYMQYDEHKNVEETKDIAYELVKDDIEKTNIRQREVEVQMKKQELDTRQKLEDAYDTINKQMKELREEFRINTISDENLLEHFKDDNPRDRFTSIMVAGSILGGIQLRNIWRKNGKLLDGEKEEFPYNEEQIKMIDKYNRLERTLDKLEYYAEFIFEDEEEFE